MPNIADFVSTFTGKDREISRNNRFTIAGNAAPQWPLNKLCQNITLPGRSFGTQDYRLFNIPIKYPYDVIFSEVQLSFLDDKNHSIRTFYKNWQEEVHTETGFGYMEDYLRELYIAKMNRDGSNGETVRLLNCYPMNVEAVELDMSSNDTPTIITVELIYTNWLTV